MIFGVSDGETFSVTAFKFAVQWLIKIFLRKTFIPPPKNPPSHLIRVF